jgi:hypothetical protein
LFPHLLPPKGHFFLLIAGLPKGHHYMNSDFAKRVVMSFQVGVAQQHFNVGAMSTMPIPLAPVNEQFEIVRQIEEKFAAVEECSSQAKRALDLIDHLDRQILVKGFCGELVPQDPNDEPASVLFERIQDAKAKEIDESRKGRTRRESDQSLFEEMNTTPP